MLQHNFPIDPNDVLLEDHNIAKAAVNGDEKTTLRLMNPWNTFKTYKCYLFFPNAQVFQIEANILDLAAINGHFNLARKLAQQRPGFTFYAKWLFIVPYLYLRKDLLFHNKAIEFLNDLTNGRSLLHLDVVLDAHKIFAFVPSYYLCRSLFDARRSIKEIELLKKLVQSPYNLDLKSNPKGPPATLFVAKGALQKIEQFDDWSGVALINWLLDNHIPLNLNDSDIEGTNTTFILAQLLKVGVQRNHFEVFKILQKCLNQNYTMAWNSNAFTEQNQHFPAILLLCQSIQLCPIYKKHLGFHLIDSMLKKDQDFDLTNIYNCAEKQTSALSCLAQAAEELKIAGNNFGVSVLGRCLEKLSSTQSLDALLVSSTHNQQLQVTLQSLGLFHYLVPSFLTKSEQDSNESFESCQSTEQQKIFCRYHELTLSSDETSSDETSSDEDSILLRRKPKRKISKSKSYFD